MLETYLFHTGKANGCMLLKGIVVNGNRKLTHFLKHRKLTTDPFPGLVVDLRRELLSNNADLKVG